MPQFPGYVIRTGVGNLLGSGGECSSQVLTIPSDVKEIYFCPLMTNENARQAWYIVKGRMEMSYDNRQTWSDEIGTASVPVVFATGESLLGENDVPRFVVPPSKLGQGLGSAVDVWGAHEIVIQGDEYGDRWSSVGKDIQRMGVRATHARFHVGVSMLPDALPKTIKLGILVWGTDNVGQYVASITDEMVNP